ncbi:MAG: ABC transporter ATP-binding protein [Alphaproteobacteria bacterium]|nr:ABC transporter ATP-binding protein [Alphaproteobacteria bacterium]
MLRLEGITAGYGAIDVIRGLELELRDGETVAILGPNGAGKSTLLSAITGTIRRRSGIARMGERDLMRMMSHEIVAAGVALVPEGRQIFQPLSVRDNLRLGAVRLAREGGHTLDERFSFVFGLFPRLKERQAQHGGTLSGGEQQMLAIGRALMSAPRLLLLDEPFLGLAPMVVSEIRAAIAGLRKGGLTILLVEQKLDVALDLATRACVMIKGELKLTDSTENLRRRDDLNNLYFSLAAGE